MNENTKSGKSGLSWVIKDFKDKINKYHGKDLYTVKLVRELSNLISEFPKAVIYHDMIDFERAEEIAEEN